MSSFFAFLHHVAAFTLVAALVVEFVLIRDEVTIARARSLQLADMFVGIAAGTVLVAGFLRVFYFEKGSAYYVHSVPFIAKVSVFVTLGLLSIVPTVEFLSWGKAVKAGRVPVVAASKLRTIRSIIHWELVGVVLILLCAALMAKGVGYLG
jgi:putative membrane protein